MQKSIVEILKLGPLPASVEAEVDLLKNYQELFEKIKEPISNIEAIELSKIFGPDDCFGLAWTLVHFIETAPGWPLDEAIVNAKFDWSDLLRSRLKSR